MSLMKTKPSWAPTAIATDRGWVHPISGEVFVAIGNLKLKLEAENKTTAVELENVVKPEVKEVIMDTQEVNKEKRQYNKKPKVIGEVVEQPKDVKIIGEVVEYDLETPVIGE